MNISNKYHYKNMRKFIFLFFSLVVVIGGSMFLNVQKAQAACSEQDAAAGSYPPTINLLTASPNTEQTQLTVKVNVSSGFDCVHLLSSPYSLSFDGSVRNKSGSDFAYSYKSSSTYFNVIKDYFIDISNYPSGTYNVDLEARSLYGASGINEKVATSTTTFTLLRTGTINYSSNKAVSATIYSTDGSISKQVSNTSESVTVTADKTYGIKFYPQPTTSDGYILDRSGSDVSAKYLSSGGAIGFSLKYNPSFSCSVISPTDPNLLVENDHQFNSSASGGEGPGTYTYSWDFGDGTALNILQNPTHKYSYSTAGVSKTINFTAKSGTQTCTKSITVTPTVSTLNLDAALYPQTCDVGSPGAMGQDATQVQIKITNPNSQFINSGNTYVGQSLDIWRLGNYTPTLGTYPSTKYKACNPSVIPSSNSYSSLSGNETKTFVAYFEPVPTSTVDLKIENPVGSNTFVNGPVNRIFGTDVKLSWSGVGLNSCTFAETPAVSASPIPGTKVFTLPSSGASKTYTINCNGNNGNPSDSVSVTLSAIAISPPTNLSVSSLVACPKPQMRLSWTKPSGSLTGYNVYRNTTNNFSSSVKIKSVIETDIYGDILNYYEDKDKDLLNSATYYYWVSAVYPSGESSAGPVQISTSSCVGNVEINAQIVNSNCAYQGGLSNFGISNNAVSVNISGQWLNSPRTPGLYSNAPIGNYGGVGDTATISDTNYEKANCPLNPTPNDNIYPDQCTLTEGETCVFNVYFKKKGALVVTPNPATVSMDKPVNFTATHNVDGNVTSNTNTTWLANPSNLIEFSATTKGALYGRIDGNTTITATYNGLAATTSLTVRSPSMVMIPTTPLTCTVGQTISFSNLLYDKDGPGGNDYSDAEAKGSANTTWTSDNAGIASSQGSGSFKCNGVGTVNVHGTYKYRNPTPDPTKSITADGVIVVTDVPLAIGNLNINANIVNGQCQSYNGGTLASNGLSGGSVNVSITGPGGATTFTRNPGSHSLSLGSYVVNSASISDSNFQTISCPASDTNNYNPDQFFITEGGTTTVDTYFTKIISSLSCSINPGSITVGSSESVGSTISALGGVSPYTYKYDFGDGSVENTFNSSNVRNHIYPVNTGTLDKTYNASATVKDSNGSGTTATCPQIVIVRGTASPIVSIKASYESGGGIISHVFKNNKVFIDWRSNNTVSCRVTRGGEYGFSVNGVSGTDETNNLTGTSVFEVTCVNNVGIEGSAQTTVEVFSNTLEINPGYKLNCLSANSSDIPADLFSQLSGIKANISRLEGTGIYPFGSTLTSWDVSTQSNPVLYTPQSVSGVPAGYKLCNFSPTSAEYTNTKESPSQTKAFTAYFAPVLSCNLTSTPLSGSSSNVTLNTTAVGGSGSYQYKFDYTNDGTYDTNLSSSASVTTTYPSSGQVYTAKVYVSDGTDSTTCTAGVSSLSLDVWPTYNSNDPKNSDTTISVLKNNNVFVKWEAQNASGGCEFYKNNVKIIPTPSSPYNTGALTSAVTPYKIKCLGALGSFIEKEVNATIFSNVFNVDGVYKKDCSPQTSAVSFDDPSVDFNFYNGKDSIRISVSRLDGTGSYPIGSTLTNWDITTQSNPVNYTAQSASGIPSGYKLCGFASSPVSYQNKKESPSQSGTIVAQFAPVFSCTVSGKPNPTDTNTKVDLTAVGV
ncbi:MAG: PKD domain-containing protein, partial [Candidatus Paceibacterota bacterium]